MLRGHGLTHTGAAESHRQVPARTQRHPLSFYRKNLIIYTRHYSKEELQLLKPQACIFIYCTFVSMETLKRRGAEGPRSQHSPQGEPDNGSLRVRVRLERLGCA